MSGERSVTLLHVSDMQFGAKHRFGADGLTSGDRRFSTLAARLLDDIEVLRAEHGLRPDLIVASGDLAEHAKPREFAQVRDFLAELADGLNVPRYRVVIVPGNHDVNWTKCQAYFLNCEADDSSPVAPYWPKWEPYAAMFKEFYAADPNVDFPPDLPWSIFEIPKLKTVVLGLNSTMAESHRDDDHYGFCGEEQLRWFARSVAKRAEDGWLRIGVLHHNPVIADKDDDAYLRDARLFEEILAPHLHLVLHGHTHEGRLCSFGPDGLPMLSAGSAGVRADARPDDVPNQYQMVRITRHGLKVYARRYNPSRYRWEGDTSIGRRPDESVRELGHEFEQAHAVFPRPDDDRPVRDRRSGGGRGHLEAYRRGIEAGRRAADEDDLLARVRRVCGARMPEATVETIEIGLNPLVRYLRVTETEKPHVRQYPIGVHEGTATHRAVEEFLRTVDARYRPGDPYMTSVLVYDGEPVAADLRTWASMKGVRLQSLMEFQGMYDLRPYASRQANRLAERNDIYPPELYVPQRYTVISGKRRAAAAEPSDDLLTQMQEWLADHHGHFIVVLGDFGHGKTFLLRELTRRVNEEGQPPVVPIFVQLRDLDKAYGLEQMLAAHLTDGGEERIDHPTLRYLIREGRVVLLFDGFDELAQRVTYAHATEHFTNVLQAAQGRAKIVLTSRTQHFLSDQQVEKALAEQAAQVPGHRLVKIEEFGDDQILAFLTRLLDGDKEKANAWMELLRDVRDLLGLSRNPRMLSFIARLDEARLRRIRDQEGEISAAVLYRELVNKWLEFEHDRAHPPGGAPALTAKERRDAVTQLALALWNSGEETLCLDDLGAVSASALAALADRQLTADQATHMIGSGTLLVRTEAGRFRFVHRSVMEWLVADHAAEELRKNGSGTLPTLAVREMSELMTDFFCTLAGRERAVAWAREVLTG
jgi:3',5'-cyclic AMP phosphodiesterase CpdA